MSIGVHFEADEPLFGRHWLFNDLEGLNRKAQEESVETWDDIKARWDKYVKSQPYLGQYKLFEPWLIENYNPPTKK